MSWKKSSDGFEYASPIRYNEAYRQVEKIKKEAVDSDSENESSQQDEQGDEDSDGDGKNFVILQLLI